MENSPSKYSRNVSLTGDIKFSNLKHTKPADYAAGVSGINAALSHSLREMGLIRSFSTLSKLNQIGGFDCPGCAWPDPQERSKLGEFCENGAKAVAEEATTKRVEEEFFKKHSVEELSQWSDYEIGKSGRLTQPFVLQPGEKYYKPISWNDSFKLIGENLSNLDNPNEAIFYTSGRSSNEAAFLYGLFARAFGTNNMPDCSNMCHESSGVGLSETLGIGKGSVVLEDFDEAEVVLIIGQNPGTNHPRMLSALQKCKQNGGKIISINPLIEAGLTNFKNPQQVNGLVGGGTHLADLFLQVNINQDVSLLKSIMKRLLQLEKEGKAYLDREFIETKTSGFESLEADLEKQSIEDLLNRAGINQTEFEKAVSILAEKKKIIICWAMGLTQHKNGVENVKECVNLLLLKGSIGIKGGGTCPVRGHSNVQGDRTVGIMHYVSKPLNEALKKEFDFDSPDTIGYDTVGAIKAMYEKKAKVFIALGGNFLSAASDTYYTAEALQNCELTVSISTKLNRTHLVTGKTSIILPTLGRTEKDIKNGNIQFLTVENSMGKVHQTKGGLSPASKTLKSEPEIVGSIAHYALGQKVGNINWSELSTNYSLLRQKMSKVLFGFENYENRSSKTGFYLPNNAREANFAKLPGGKALFSINSSPDHNLEQDEFILMTIRSHDQFNTTIYGMNDRYRGIYNERRVLFINQEDITKHNLKPYQIVNLQSEYKNQIRKATSFKIIPYNIPKGNLATYFPEANVLVPINLYADKSHTPVSKSIKVKITVPD